MYCTAYCRVLYITLDLFHLLHLCQTVQTCDNLPIVGITWYNDVLHCVLQDTVHTCILNDFTIVLYIVKLYTPVSAKTSSLLVSHSIKLNVTVYCRVPYVHTGSLNDFTAVLYIVKLYTPVPSANLLVVGVLLHTY